ncbi:MAG TPA: sigma-70 family RNA polymerase sigma factor [Urbifossiella sp.]|nr:sigma-70 family RNA polymerase sigma factor [Urbifossiella sp.]
MPLPDLTRRFGPPDATGDAELLRRFADHRDEAAFELIVWRHGGMVLAACRRVLGRSADADDAFQVTFLALARRAAAIRDGAALPGWLHRVARRAAGRVKAAAARRAERTMAALPEPAVEPTAPDDFGPVLDEEIDRLPEKLRRAFVLCHLEGVTNEAAAERLGCPKGTVLSRLSRARERLRDRLTRRGVVAPAAVTLPAAAPPSAAVAAATARAAAAFVVGPPPAEVPTHVVTITQGVLRTMRLTQLRPIGLVVALVLVAGVGLAASAGRPAPPADPPLVPVAVPVATAQPGPARPAAPRVLDLKSQDWPQVGPVVFSPDGSLLAVPGHRTEGMTTQEVLSVWEVATGKLRYAVRGEEAGGAGLTFSPDGKSIALPCTELGEVVVRGVGAVTGREVLRVKHRLVSGAAYSPDGKHLVTISTAFAGRETISELRVWDAATGRERFAVPTEKGEVLHGPVFGPDGRMVVGTSLKTVRVFDPATGKERPPLRLPGDWSPYVALTPDGSKLFLVVDGRPKLLDAATGREVRAFGGAGPACGYGALSPDGTRVLGVTTENRVVVWDAATGAEKSTMGRAEERVSDGTAYFTPDGLYVVATWSQQTADGTDQVPWLAVYAADGRPVRRERGVKGVDFDPATRSVAVVTGHIIRADGTPPDTVTIHDAASWLAGGAKKE